MLADFVKSNPHDVMHLLLRGVCKTLVELFFGIHSKSGACCSFIINNCDIADVEKSLDVCATGFPSDWGRAPIAVSQLGKFKADTFKNFAMFYLVPIFYGLFSQSRSPSHKAKLDLCSTFQSIIYISFNHVPKRSDIEKLKVYVQKFHALYSMVFEIDADHRHCYTPSTHAILHLHEILEDCGPLPNVSQFLAERVVGELGRTANTAQRLEAHLLNQYLHGFSLRMLAGGLRQ